MYFIIKSTSKKWCYCIAYTPVDEYVPLANIISNTREGIRGVGGVQTRGTYRTGMPGL